MEFENDVKAEGTKLPALYKCFLPSFENDVKAEGTKLPATVKSAALV